MRLVILDAHTLNPGDLSWDALRALADCAIHPRTAAADIVARAHDADLILTNKTPLAATTLAALPRLKFVSVLATGHNVVDSAAARARGIPVSNVPAYGTRAVAQHTLALLLELAHHVGHHAATVRAGRWAAAPDWCYWDHPLLELDGLALGIVGYGRIGRAVADLGRALGMTLLAHSRGDTPGAEKVPLDELFRRADVVSLHCPLTPETQHLVNARRLALMKPTALLLNTSRGALVHEADLAAALAAGRLAAAAVDVLSTEPPAPDNPLLAAPHCLVTPHQAWAARAARARLLAVTVANVRAFLAGTPQHVVN